MEKILIVDNNLHELNLIKEILLNGQTAYEIHECACDVKAFDQINRLKPDLIILDSPMSNPDGVSFLKENAVRFKNFIPILIISTFNGQADRLQSLEYGATDFINKPIMPEEIIARTAALVRLKKLYDDKEWLTEKTNEGIRMLYKELELKNTELQKLDQLKSDFVSTVSHEIRTPLAITTEGLSLVLDGIPGEINPKQRKILTTAKNNVDRLKNIINDLLDISKIEAGRMDMRYKEVDLINVLREVEDGYQPLAKTAKINLSFHYSCESLKVNVDRDKFIQIMNNLLNNAVKFTSENGEIEVKVEPEEECFWIRVSDNGIGIDAAELDKVFKKFQQFSREHGPGIKGTGLGLAITKSLVEMHQGEIGLHSKLGKGTTFFFKMPFKPKESENG